MNASEYSRQGSEPAPFDVHSKSIQLMVTDGIEVHSASSSGHVPALEALRIDEANKLWPSLRGGIWSDFAMLYDLDGANVTDVVWWHPVDLSTCSRTPNPLEMKVLHFLLQNLFPSAQSFTNAFIQNTHKLVDDNTNSPTGGDDEDVEEYRLRVRIVLAGKQSFGSYEEAMTESYLAEQLGIPVQ